MNLLIDVTPATAAAAVLYLRDYADIVNGDAVAEDLRAMERSDLIDTIEQGIHAMLGSQVENMQEAAGSDFDYVATAIEELQLT